MDEFQLIDRYFRHRGASRRDVALGIGDDAAVVQPNGRHDLVFTLDVLVNGVHFPESSEPSAIGHKALAVNLSDIAAMGATPAWATLGLTLPKIDEAWLQEFCDGFFGLAEEFDVQLIGGDVTRGPLSIAVQVIGLTGEHGYVTRSGAREGDLIYVSGTLGDAALGLRVASDMLVVTESDRDFFLGRLNRPVPRVALGAAIAPFATAAIDVSDGLAADLGHLCGSSGVGAEVDIARLPMSDAYRRHASKVGSELMLTFGDDYELCFTASPKHAGDIEQLCENSEFQVTRIGEIKTGPVRWNHDGKPLLLDDQGYRHFR